MKKTVNPFDYAGDICKALPGGILLTTKLEDKVNTMTIGWGTIGIEWGKPIFVAYVRESRFTREMLDGSGEFTVNIPYGEVNKQILGFCGTKSGRDVDKIKALGLNLVDSDVVAAPGIKELPLTLECKVLFKNKQDESLLPEQIKSRYYSSINAGDFHYAYYGEIVNAYLICGDTE
ncbi:MAG: flavin reductase family protein [Oscillospiraceae bacterium]|nr:flavin reductase family protein [Oscillospiraceae bacterium]